MGRNCDYLIMCLQGISILDNLKINNSKGTHSAFNRGQSIQIINS